MKTAKPKTKRPVKVKGPVLLSLNRADYDHHPLLARMAMEGEAIAYLRASNDKDNQEELERREAAQEALLESVRAHGVMEPARVIRNGAGQILLVDGRHRAWACEMLGIPLPAVEIPEVQAEQVIFSSFAHRRHLSKGAIAWLAVTLNPDVANTKPGRPDNSHSVGIIRANLALQAGVSLPLLDQACKLWTATKKVPSLKVKIDAGIAAGSGLGALIAGLEGAGNLPTGEDGKPTRPAPNVNSYCRTLATVGTQLKAFATWGEVARAEAVEETARLLRANESARALFTAALAAADAASEADAT